MKTKDFEKIQAKCKYIDYATFLDPPFCLKKFDKKKHGMGHLPTCKKENCPKMKEGNK